MTPRKDPPDFDDPRPEGQDEEAAMEYYDGSGDSSASNEAERVIREHESSLLALPGVVGVQTGETRAGDTCIVVLIRASEHGAVIPRRLGGLSVRVEVTGDVDAQDA